MKQGGQVLSDVQAVEQQQAEYARAPKPPAPLLLPAGGLIVGIAFDELAGGGPAPYLAGIVIAAGLLAWPFARRECVKVVVVLAAFCIGGLSHARQLRRLPPDHMLRYTQATPTLARVRGTIATEPALQPRRSSPFTPWWPDPPRSGFLLQAEAVQVQGGWAEVSGAVKVSVKEPVTALAAGDRVELFGWCYRPRAPANPGQFDWARYARRRGVFVNLTCNHGESIRRVSEGPPSSAALWSRFRQRVRTLLLDDLLSAGGPTATLLDTLVLGRRSAIDPALNERFIRIGCAHYLAVSGMHVGMVGLFVWLLGRALGGPARACAVAVMLASVVYALVADPRPPILRATVMTITVCMGMVLGRPRNFLNALALAAMLILLVRPTDLFDAGFQLSFTAVWAIVYLSPLLIRLPQRWRPAVIRSGAGEEVDIFSRRPAVSRFGRLRRGAEARVWWMLSASCAAWLASLPLVLAHFQRFALWGWLNSVLLFPVVLVLMAASFIKLLCALAWPALGSLLNGPVAWLASALIAVVGWLEHLPAAPRALSYFPWWLSTLPCGAVVLWAGRHRWFQGRRGKVVLACAFLAGPLVWLAPRPDAGRLRMTVLSVGHGSSIVLELPGGQVVLYDAGASGSYDPGRSTIVPFLRQRGIRRIDAVFLSHPNLDHFSGLPTVLDELNTGPVYVTPYFEPLSRGGQPSRVLLNELAGRKHPLRIVDRTCEPLSFGDASVEVLWPPPDLGPETASNETSLVLRVTHAGRSILLTGDIETLAQGRLLAEGELYAEVMELPHHGSLRHNTLAFVEAVDPELVVSSTSIRSSLNRAEQDRILAGRPHYSTADHGAITVTFEPDRLSVKTNRPAAAGSDEGE